MRLLILLTLVMGMVGCVKKPVDPCKDLRVEMDALKFENYVLGGQGLSEKEKGELEYLRKVLAGYRKMQRGAGVDK